MGVNPLRLIQQCPLRDLNGQNGLTRVRAVWVGYLLNSVVWAWAAHGQPWLTRHLPATREGHPRALRSEKFQSGNNIVVLYGTCSFVI